MDQVCEDILSAKDKIEAAWTLCREARTRKPIIHFAATVFTLFTLAWLGNTINNFFLAYLMNVTVLMLPGKDYEIFKVLVIVFYKYISIS